MANVPSRPPVAGAPVKMVKVPVRPGMPPHPPVAGAPVKMVKVPVRPGMPPHPPVAGAPVKMVKVPVRPGMPSQPHPAPTQQISRSETPQTRAPAARILPSRTSIAQKMAEQYSYADLEADLNAAEPVSRASTPQTDVYAYDEPVVSSVPEPHSSAEFEQEEIALADDVEENEFNANDVADVEENIYEEIPQPSVTEKALQEERIPDEESSTEEEFVSSPVKQSKVSVPKHILREVKRQKNPLKRLLTYYSYMRAFAEDYHMETGYTFPPFALNMTQENSLQQYSGNERRLFEDMSSDLKKIAACMPRVSRLMNANGDPADMIEKENERVAGKRLSQEDEIGLAYLFVKVGFEEYAYNSAIKALNDEQKENLQSIRDNEEKIRRMRQQFVDAIKKKQFPVDAEKLVRNYFNFSKHDPEKAFELLITSPFYFSPIQPEKYAKNGKINPDTARDLNKKLGSFLKNLKI